MRNQIKLVLVAVAMSGLAGTAGATSVTLDSLLVPGASIQVGDKIFDDFGWNSATIPSAGINVQTIEPGNPLFTGNFGIDVQGSLTVIGPGTVDADLTFRVSVVGPQKISDIHSLVNAGGSGLFSATVNEEVFDAKGNILTSLLTGALTGVNFQSGGALVVPPQSVVLINKDINLVASTTGSLASISDIQQTFSQTGVPDGGTTLALLGVALLGVEGLRRKVTK